MKNIVYTFRIEINWFDQPISYLYNLPILRKIFRYVSMILPKFHAGLETGYSYNYCNRVYTSVTQIIVVIIDASHLT